MTTPACPVRFQQTYCSQCGSEFGPGNSGFSHCSDHNKAPLILKPLSDWRENPYPYPLRKDDKPRAVWPQGVA
jgi:hypothetical protein